MMVIENKFDIGATVYLITDKDQNPRLVTGIYIRPTGLMYTLNAGTICSEHFEIEMTLEKNVLIQVS